MPVTVQAEKELVVPAAVRRRAGIKRGDRVKFDVSAGLVVISSLAQRSYRPTKKELAAIRHGEAALARGEYLSLAEFLNEMDDSRRKAGTKTARKGAR